MLESSPLFVLTTSQVDAKISRLEEIEARIEELVREKEEISRWILAVETVVGRKIVGAESDQDSEKLTFPRFVKEAVEAAPMGITLNELKERILHTSLKDQYERNSNSLYNTVSRLTGRNELVRAGDLIFFPEHYQKLRASGQLGALLDAAESKENVPQIIEDYLRGLGEVGIAEIRSRLEESPALRDRLERNPQYVYTVLGRMAKRGQLIRGEVGYRLDDGKEAPSAGSGDASLNAGGGDGLNTTTSPIQGQKRFTDLLG